MEAEIGKDSELIIIKFDLVLFCDGQLWLLQTYILCFLSSIVYACFVSVLYQFSNI